MTVKELKDILTTMPYDLEVFVAERKTEFQYGLVNSAYAKEINFTEDPYGEILCRERVLILDEE
jgi:hypothetical protein